MGDEFRSTYLVENRLQMRVRHTAFSPERMYLEKLKIVFFEVAIVSHVCDIENAKTKIATKCVFLTKERRPRARTSSSSVQWTWLTHIIIYNILLYT